MLKYRAISFTVLSGVAAFIFFGGAAGLIALKALILALAVLSSLELSGILAKCGLPSWRIATALWFLLIFALVMFFDNDGLIAGVYITLIGIYAALIGVLFVGDRKLYAAKFLHSIGVIILTLLPFIFTGLCFIFTQTQKQGIYFFAFMILASKAMDTGGYIAGMLSARWMKNGNHKLCPSISPKKSWEGAIGGLLLSLLVAFLFYHFRVLNDLHDGFFGLPLWWYLSAGAALSCASLLGDLTESALKRSAEIKDSGNILPGMGGVLDLLDSFIYAPAVFFIFILILR